MTPLLYGILIAMFIGISVIKLGLLFQKKSDIASLKLSFQTGQTNQIITNIVNKIKHDKKFNMIFALLIFGDCFMYSLQWYIGTAQFIFSLFIILLMSQGGD